MWILPLSVSLWLVVGCSSPQESPLVRLIEEEPQEFLEAETLVDIQEVVSWRFESPDDLAGWEAQNLDRRFEVVAGELSLLSSSIDPFISRPVDVDTRSVDAVRVSMTLPTWSIPQLFWAGTGEAYSEERSLTPDSGQGQRGDGEYWFDLRSHPRWSGHVTRLRLDPTALPDQEVRISRISAVRRHLPVDSLRDAAASAWRVNLGNEVRSAVLAVPGRRFVTRLRVRPDAQLRFGLGVRRVTAPAPRPHPWSFRVSWEVEGDAPRLLFDMSLDLENHLLSPGWQDLQLDLSALAGQEGDLVLDTVASQPDRLSSLPFWGSPEIVYPQPAPQPPNVVLLSIDTLRADRMSLYGYERETTPHIDAWARRSGATFLNAVAQAPWTLPSHVSMFTGLDPFSHGVNYRMSAPPHLRMLAEILRDAGYRTAAVTGGGYLDPRFGLAQGFDAYLTSSLGAGAPDELSSGVSRALSFLEESIDLPFFLFFHTYEVHSPYHPRRPYVDRWGGPSTTIDASARPRKAETGFRARDTLRWQQDGRPGRYVDNEDLGLLDNLYDAGIAYTDEHVGRLLRGIQDLELDQATLVILTSDHGEMLGEHGRFLHQDLYDEVLRIPLVFVYPERFPGRATVSAQVRSIDILPTVLETLGLDVEPRVDGASFLAALDRQPLPSRYEAWTYGGGSNAGVSLRLDSGLKYWLDDNALSDQPGAESLHHLGRDPQELTNLAPLLPDQAGALRARTLSKLRTRSGLRVAFTNASSQSFSGSLGKYLVPGMLKSADLDCDCLRWAGSGTLRFVVPPGEVFTLILDGFSGEPLSIEGLVETETNGRDSSFATTLVPSTSGESWGIGWSGTAWRELADTEPRPSLTIRVWWQGDPGLPPSPGPMDLDPVLLERLRTLGYVR